MKKILTILILLISFLNVFAQAAIDQQDETTPERNVNIDISQITVEYNFNGIDVNKETHKDTIYHHVSINGFGKTNIPGLPIVPSRTDLIALPDNAAPEITIMEAEYEEFENFLLFPGFKPLTDNINDSLIFEKNHKFYKENKLWPKNTVVRENDMQFREISVFRAKIHPVQYNPAQKKIRVYKKIKYKINYKSEDFSNFNKKNSKDYINSLKRLVLNSSNLSYSEKSRSYNELNYLIVTVPEYFKAADSLSAWKNQLGYRTKIIMKQNWTPQQVKDSVAHYYNISTPHPDYVVFLGDHENVPAQIIDSNNNFVSDLYYVCMNGPGDFHPDMAKGRISADDPKEALNIIRKIISYEKTPSDKQSFYTNGMNCAQFQDDEPDGYANRRFIHTSEEVRNYLLGKGYNIKRVYATDTSINPLYYNDGYYSDGQAIPTALLRSNGFEWDGDHNDITNSLNEGRFYVLHRDHGYTEGWGTPAFSVNNFDQIQNPDLYPVVFSINCSSGRFSANQCFSEELLSLENRGAVGVVGASNTSYSGYNDALSIGIFDAIWSNPGLTPDFGSAGVLNPPSTPHNDIYKLGDVLNHGLIRMTETYEDIERQYQLFHYFGDPAMEIRTQFPETVTATSANSLSCGDTSLIISGYNFSNLLATLVVDGNIISKKNLTGNTDTLFFNPVSNISPNAILTVSKTNTRPYVKELPIVNCTNPPAADFIVPFNQLSVCEGKLQLFDISDYSPDQWEWNITPGNYYFASGSSASSQNPIVIFDSPGLYTVSLKASNSFGSDSIIKTNLIEITSPLSIPFTDDLEIYSHTIDMENSGWSFYSSGNDYKWNINNDSTPSLYTGPIFDHTTGDSTGNYIYTEASGANHYDTAYFQSSCLSIPSNNITLLTFWYHMHGGDIYKLIIDVKSNGVWNKNLFTIQGEQQDDYDDPWIKDTLDLSQFAGSNIKIRFRAINGPGYQGDIALDDINISTSNSAPQINFSSEEIYTCEGFNVQFHDNSCCGITSRTWTFEGGIPSTSSAKDPLVNYPAAGTYFVKLQVQNQYGEDSTVKSGYINVGDFNDIPLSEDFETFVTGNPGTFVNSWETQKSDDYEWRVNSGGTPSYDTGPLSDHTTGNSSGKYVYTEASYVSFFEKAFLFTPCLSKNSQNQSTILSFWYHMYGTNIDTLFVDVNNGNQWENVFYIEGVHQSDHSDAWKKAYVNITNYTLDNFRLRFRSMRGNSYNADISIDDVKIDTIAAFNYSTSDDSIIFDTTEIYNTEIKDFSLTNEGSMPITIDSLFAGMPFTVSSVNKDTVNPGDSVSISLEYSPQNIGTNTDQLNIQSPKGTIIIPMKGVCVNYHSINAKAGQNIKLYPNPADDYLYFSADEKYSLKIFDLSGKLIKQREEIVKGRILCESIKPGLYFVKISNDDNSYYRKIIIN